MSEVTSVSNQSMSQLSNVTPVQKGGLKQCVPFSAAQLVVPRSPLEDGFKVGEIFTSRIEALEKVTKNTDRLISIGLKLKVWTSDTLDNCSTNLKVAVDLFDTIRFVAMINALFSTQKNGKYFLFDEKNGAIKKADRLFMAGHLVCKSARALNKWRLIDLGRIAKVKIGQCLSAYSAFTDSLLVGSCIFNVLDSSNNLRKFGERSTANAANIQKWEERPRILELVKEGNAQVIEDLKKHWEQKIINKQEELEQRKQDFIKHPAAQAKKEIKHLIRSMKKVELRLTHISAKNHNLLFQEMSRVNPADKLEKWRVKQESLVHDRNTNWVKIASSVTKIAVVAMAMIFNAFNFMAVLPCVTLMTLGIITDSFGLAKIVMEQFAKDKK